MESLQKRWTPVWGCRLFKYHFIFVALFFLCCVSFCVAQRAKLPESRINRIYLFQRNNFHVERVIFKRVVPPFFDAPSSWCPTAGTTKSKQFWHQTNSLSLHATRSCLYTCGSVLSSCCNIHSYKHKQNNTVSLPETQLQSPRRIDYRNY